MKSKKLCAATLAAIMSVGMTSVYTVGGIGMTAFAAEEFRSIVLHSSDQEIDWGEGTNVQLPASTFENALEGDKIKVTFSAKSGLEGENKYYCIKFLSMPSSGWAALAGMPNQTGYQSTGSISFDESATTYEYVIDATDLAEIKANGMAIQGHGIISSKVELLTKAAATKYEGYTQFADYSKNFMIDCSKAEVGDKIIIYTLEMPDDADIQMMATPDDWVSLHKFGKSDIVDDKIEYTLVANDIVEINHNGKNNPGKLAFLGNKGWAKAELVKAEKFDITKADTEYGTFTVSAEKAAAGTEVTITPKPDEGYDYEVSVTDADGKAVTVTDNKFTMPESAVTVSVTFKKNAFGVTVSDTIQNGTVTVAPVSGSKGDVIKVTATPDKGYKLKAITTSVRTNGIDAPVVSADGTFTMPACDVIVFAAFEKEDYTITAAEPENGTVTVPATANYGDKVTVKCTPKNDNYTVDTVTVTDAEGNAVAVTNSAFTMPAGNVTVTVTFKELTEEEKNAEYDITVESAKNGTITATPEKGAAGTEITIGEAVPAKGYALDSVTVTNAKTGAEVEVKDGKFTMPIGGAVITPVFKAVDYKITVGDHENGKIAPASETANYGEAVAVTIFADKDFELDSVTITDAEGSVVSFDAAKGTFVMPASDVTIKAVFKEAKKEDDKPASSDTPTTPTNPTTPSTGGSTTTTTTTTTPAAKTPTESVPLDKIPEDGVSSKVVVSDKDAEAYLKLFPNAPAGAKAEDVSVELVVKPGVDSEADKQTITDKAPSGITLGGFVTIDLYAELNGVKEKITDAGSALLITLPLPDDVKAAVAKDSKLEVCMLRLHDGKVDVLADQDNDPDTVTIKTDGYSTYAFAYRAAGGNAATGIALALAPVILSGSIVAVAVYNKKKK